MQTFQAVKDLVISAPTLKLFDPAAPVTVSVDASPFGLGAVLLQDGQPVEFASRTLTETQRRYAQIESFWPCSLECSSSIIMCMGVTF